MQKNKYEYKTVKDVVDKAAEAVGHTIGEFNIKNRSMKRGKNKGVIGQIMEEGFFHYPINSKPGADFESLGVELKVTGIKQLKNNSLVFKERLVLNVINYLDESKKEFKNSSFWTKNKNLLFILYLFQYERNDYDFPIVKSFLHTFSDTDLNIIKHDYKTIIEKIKSGHAHEISESDTFYLAACTKGSKSGAELRSQPKTKKKAQQRAFCLKKTYLDKILDKEDYESIISTANFKRQKIPFEQYVIQTLNKYKGYSEKKLRKLFRVKSNNLKSVFPYLVGKMLGLKGTVNKSAEFVKGGIVLKTIRVEENNLIKEHMSFPHMNFSELANETWDNSSFKEMLSETKFMFAIFKKRNHEYYFERIMFWNVPDEILNNEVKQTWNATANVLKTGTIVKEIDSRGRFITNFPSCTLNNVCHVRPHDIKSIKSSQKGMELPVADRTTGLKRFTKQCFWLDKKLITKVINK